MSKREGEEGVCEEERKTLAGILMMERMGLLGETHMPQGHIFHSPRRIN